MSTLNLATLRTPLGFLAAAGLFGQQALAQNSDFCADVAELVRSGQAGFRSLSSSGVNEDGFLKASLPGAKECALSEDNAALFCNWDSDADSVEMDAKMLLDGLAGCLSSSIDLWPGADSALRGGIPGSKDEVFVSVNTEGLLVKLMFEVNSNSFDEIVGPPGTSQRDMETRLAERERYYSNRPVINGYSVVQLSGLGEWHVTYDINDNGEVVGAFAAASDGKNPRAFYWSPITQRMQDLGTFGGRMSAAHSINSGGDVVGWAQQADGRLAVFAWWPEAGGLREIAGMRERVKLGWMPRLAINDAGQIVGQTEDVHLFLWSPTRPNEIVDLGEDRNDNFLKRFDLSNDGRVAFAKTSADGDKRATLWSAQTGGRDLGVLNDHTLRDSAASAVSPNGRWVVGSAGYGAFIWSEATGMKRLPRDSAYAVGVNDHGDVIGNDHSGGDISNAKYRAVVWLANSNHEVRFLPVDGMTEGTVARAINNAGQIVGTFNEKAVVWDPIVGEASGR